MTTQGTTQSSTQVGSAQVGSVKAGSVQASSVARARNARSTKHHWIDGIAKLTAGGRQLSETRIPTMVTCDIRAGKRALYIPPNMLARQPRALRFLHAFATARELQLVEDRRRRTTHPSSERRKCISPNVIHAVGELLQQLGMPGSPRQQSHPHRLSAQSPHIGIDKLIQMASHAAPSAKSTVILPKQTLVDLLGGRSDPIRAYACKLVSNMTNTVLSHFESPSFRAIGHTAGRQYVMHICIAGGAANNPSIWASFHTMTQAGFRLHLFNAPDRQHDVGLLYATVYLDLDEQPVPWWLSTWADARPSQRAHRGASQATARPPRMKATG